MRWNWGDRSQQRLFSSLIVQIRILSSKQYEGAISDRSAISLEDYEMILIERKDVAGMANLFVCLAICVASLLMLGLADMAASR